MKYILLFLTLSFSFLYASSSYPSSFTKLGTPLYQEAHKLILLKDINSLKEPIRTYLEKLKLITNMGTEADKSSDKKLKLNYLKKLRLLKRDNDKIVWLLKQLLIDSIKKNDYETFNLIVESDMKDLFRKERFNKQIIAFYKKNKTEKKSSVLEKLTNKQTSSIDSSSSSSIDTSKMTNRELYEDIRNLLDNYSGEQEILTKATELTQLFLSRDPNNPLALINKGRLLLYYGYINGNNFNQDAVLKAQDIFISVQKKNPKLFDAYLFSAFTYLLQNSEDRLKNTKLMANICKSLEPQSLRLQILYAKIAQEENNHVKLAQISKSILSRTDTKWILKDVYRKLSRMYVTQKKDTLANEMHLKIIKISPNSPWAMINYCTFLIDQKAFDDAILYGEKSLSLLDFEMGHYQLSKAYYNKGAYLHWELKKRKESRNYFFKAAEHNPKHSNTYYGIGMSYYHTGYHTKNVSDLRKSKLALEEAIRLKPDHKQASQQLRNLNKLLVVVGR